MSPSKVKTVCRLVELLLKLSRLELNKGLEGDSHGKGDNDIAIVQEFAKEW